MRGSVLSLPARPRAGRWSPTFTGRESGPPPSIMPPRVQVPLYLGGSNFDGDIGWLSGRIVVGVGCVCDGWIWREVVMMEMLRKRPRCYLL